MGQGGGHYTERGRQTPCKREHLCRWLLTYLGAAFPLVQHSAPPLLWANALPVAPGWSLSQYTLAGSLSVHTGGLITDHMDGAGGEQVPAWHLAFAPCPSIPLPHLACGHEVMCSSPIYAT